MALSEERQKEMSELKKHAQNSKKAAELIGKLTRKNRLSFIKEDGTYPYAVNIQRGSGGYIVTRQNTKGGGISSRTVAKRPAIAHASIALDDEMSYEFKSGGVDE